MAAPAEIKLYLDDETEPFAMAYSDDGVNFSTTVDIPDGIHTIRARAKKVGDTESDLSDAVQVTVGANSAPSITSPKDWDEIQTDTVDITVQANAGETVRIYANGVQKAEVTANGSGVATANISLDSSSVIGVDVHEVITARRVIAGVPSLPSQPVNLPTTYGRLSASGVTTMRLFMTSLLLGYLRHYFPLPWDNELINGVVGGRSTYKYTKTTGETQNAFISLRYLNPAGAAYHAPGYIDSVWLRRHLNRVKSDTVGKVNYHIKMNGDGNWPVVPMWFDFATHTAMAYFRGDRSVYSTYKNKILEILNALSPDFMDSSGLVRQGNYYTSRLRNHGWPGIPTDHGSSWYASHQGSIGDDEGITDVVYWPETEATIRWIFATNLVKKMATLEGDTATVTICDNYLSTFKAGISGRVTSAGDYYGANLVKQAKFAYDLNSYPTGADGNVGWAATIMAIAMDAFSTPEERTAVASAFRNKMTSRNSNTQDGYGEYTCPLYCGTIAYAGLFSPFNDVMQHTAQYISTGYSGALAYALSLNDASFGRTVAEDMVRFNIAWWQGSVLNYGLFYVHNLSAWKWTHMASGYGIGPHNGHSWLKEADDRYADLADIVVSGTQGSTATLAVPFGHRVTGADIVASESCQATIEIYANDAQNGITAITSANTQWPPTPSYGADILMATININGTTASMDTGMKPAACYSGGRIKVKVASVTGTPPTNFTVTPKQARISPTFEADDALGFTDNFTTDRLSEYDVIEGNINTCSVYSRYDKGPASIGNVDPLTRTLFKTTATSGWTSLVQKNTLFTNGVVMLVQALRNDAVLDANGGYPSTMATGATFLRVSSDGLSYIKVSSDGVPYYPDPELDETVFYFTVTEVVNGSVVHETVISSSADQALYQPTGRDELYLVVSVKGSELKMFTWRGGTPYPFQHGLIGYGGGCNTSYTIQSSSLLGAGKAGFGLSGACEIEAVRICGDQDQPLPPGFILDTGLNVPPTEMIVPRCHLTGELIVPASDTCCLRNEWGARVSDIVTGYNPRWSY